MMAALRSDSVGVDKDKSDRPSSRTVELVALVQAYLVIHFMQIYSFSVCVDNLFA